MGDSRIGAILIKQGLIARPQLSGALRSQQYYSEQRQWRLIGEILVEKGQISDQALEAALRHQFKQKEPRLFGTEVHPSVQSLAKRTLDISGALVGLAIFAILLPMIALCIYLDSHGPVFFVQYRIGLRGKQFKIIKFRTMIPNAEQEKLKVATSQVYKFFNNRNDPRVTSVGRILRKFHLDELPQFFNVLMGDMSLVGTRPPTLDEVKYYSNRDWQRLSIKPGMTGVWQTSTQKYSLNFEQVIKLDLHYIRNWNLQTDLRIIARTFLQIVYPFLGKAQAKVDTGIITSQLPVRRVQLLNIEFDNFTTTELLYHLRRGVVFTPNVDHLIKLQKDEEFFKAYTSADYRVCDSQVLIYASHFLGTPFKEKISGSDLFPTFCDFHRHNSDIRIFLLGGREGVAERAKTNINRRIGRDIVVGAHSPSFSFATDEGESQQIIKMIQASKATVLAVGVGAPKQEKWIYRCKDKLKGVDIFMAIGATIDFEAGVVKRAPKWVSSSGLEWLYRLLHEPSRLWKRYLVDDLAFLRLIISQKLGLYELPFKSLTLSDTSSRKLQYRR
jgi:N-acetylglucosaminyldiphosphoundecaprenol N-acetyl-beta-D-mannosaminyltransferase